MKKIEHEKKTKGATRSSANNESILLHYLKCAKKNWLPIVMQRWLSLPTSILVLLGNFVKINFKKKMMTSKLKRQKVQTFYRGCRRIPTFSRVVKNEKRKWWMNGKFGRFAENVIIFGALKSSSLAFNIQHYFYLNFHSLFHLLFSLVSVCYFITLDIIFQTLLNRHILNRIFKYSTNSPRTIW